MKHLYIKRGIVVETSAPHAHNQNGIAERANRTIRESASTILIESGLPEAFWAEAVSFATYTRNRCPTRRRLADGVHDTNMSPHERYLGRKPSYDHIHPFGCLVYVTTLKEKRIKSLSQYRSWKGIFIGYTKTEH